MESSERVVSCSFLYLLHLLCFSLYLKLGVLEKHRELPVAALHPHPGIHVDALSSGSISNILSPVATGGEQEQIGRRAKHLEPALGPSSRSCSSKPGR